MDNVAVIVLYAIPNTGVPAFGCAYHPDGRLIAMALAEELAPEVMARATVFFESLQGRAGDAIFQPHEDGRGATVALPSANEFGFDVIDRGTMLAPLDEADVDTWLRWAFTTTREATINEQAIQFTETMRGEFDGLG